MTPETTAQQIRSITTTLLIGSMIDHQHLPEMRRSGSFTNIGIAGAPDLSSSMRESDYDKVYISLISAGAYHFKLIDGALIQLLYGFERGELISHRLAYFPSPKLAAYDEAAELYEQDEMFAEIFAGSNVRSPVRFDFSSSDEKHVDVEHPRSHLSLGQYKGCRIPVDGPLTPMRFMRFILRNFYNSAYALVNIDEKASATGFIATITPNERAILHINA